MKHKEDENFNDYKNRMVKEKATLRNYLKGRVVWDHGTYIKKVHGDLI